MKLLPASITYKCAMPRIAANLAELIDKLPFVELSPSDFNGIGFIEPIQHEGLVLTFDGGYAFALRYDEKIVPASAVKAETKKRSSKIKEEQGFKPGRKQTKEIREAVQAELTHRALTKSKVIQCFYIIEHNLLMLPTTSKSLADRVMARIVKAMCSLEATTIYLSTAKSSLTTRLMRYLESDYDSFGDFIVGSKCKLCGSDGEKFSFDLSQSLSGANQGLREAVAGGALVSEIELRTGAITFRLTEEFRLKGISMQDDGAGSEEFDSELDHWKHEAAVQTRFITEAINDLCELLGYKESDLCGKVNSGHACTMKKGSECPDCAGIKGETIGAGD